MKQEPKSEFDPNGGQMERERTSSNSEAARYCCAEFREQAESVTSSSPLSLAYAAAGMGNDAQFVKNEDGTWSIAGCCGGGCNVVEGMRFCPYCGVQLNRMEASSVPKV